MSEVFNHNDFVLEPISVSDSIESSPSGSIESLKKMVHEPLSGLKLAHLGDHLDSETIKNPSESYAAPLNLVELLKDSEAAKQTTKNIDFPPGQSDFDGKGALSSVLSDTAIRVGQVSPQDSAPVENTNNLLDSTLLGFAGGAGVGYALWTNTRTSMFPDTWLNKMVRKIPGGKLRTFVGFGGLIGGAINTGITYFTTDTSSVNSAKFKVDLKN